jgi:dethiobiotin synthetase
MECSTTQLTVLCLQHGRLRCGENQHDSACKQQLMLRVLTFLRLQAAAAAHSTSAAAAATYLRDSATLFAYSDPVSPHLAAAQEGRIIPDGDIVTGLAQQLQRFAAGLQAQDCVQGLSVVETAGGVTSPGPSGNLQVGRHAAGWTSDTSRCLGL